MQQVEILIVGAGAAGISAAVSAREAGCRDILLADRGAGPGGILPQCMHEGFGIGTYGEELTGPDYAARLAEPLSRSGVQLLSETEVLSVTEDRTALLSRRGSLHKISFRRLILACGSRERSLGSLPVAGARPAGIFTAGDAQARINLYRQDLGSEVLILGSGDLGMLMARRFTLEGKHVIAVLEQNSRYGGLARNYHRCMEALSIPLRCRMTVREVHGEGRIRGVTAFHLDSGETEFIPCDTLITALGLIPDRELSRGLEAKDWLYLSGNCSRIHDIADSAAAEGRAMGLLAARSLSVFP